MGKNQTVQPSQPSQPNQKPKNWFNYGNAWIKYGGEFLIRLSNIGNVIRDSFSDIQIPKKEDY